MAKRLETWRHAWAVKRVKKVIESILVRKRGWCPTSSGSTLAPTTRPTLCVRRLLFCARTVLVPSNHPTHDSLSLLTEYLRWHIAALSPFVPKFSPLSSLPHFLFRFSSHSSFSHFPLPLLTRRRARAVERVKKVIKLILVRKRGGARARKICCTRATTGAAQGLRPHVGQELERSAEQGRRGRNTPQKTLQASKWSCCRAKGVP
mmetsp:Transcript_36432/g.91692  ORF Transcript_36432/g.91692 Transcript_36432/m.91692 type:complete len:205 (-) Transcript_36432:85-699(-)